MAGDRVPTARVPADPEPPTTAEGDGGFERFCRAEYAAVAGLAYVLTGDWTAAEDLTQDAFFAAYRRWPTIQGYDRPGAWVRRVVANRAVSRRRRAGAEARALLRLGGRRTPVADHGGIAEPADDVWAAVRRLPPRQAQVVALSYIDDLSLEQVAAVLGIAPGTAKTHLARARTALQIGAGVPTEETGDDHQEDVP